MSASPAALDAIAHELDLLRAHVDRLAPVVAAGVSAAPTHIADAQRVDLMAQSLAAIASLARDLARGRGMDDAISQIALADLAARLASATGAADAPQSPHGHEMELF